MNKRQLSDEEIIALQTMNCCANAIIDKLPKVERRLKANGKGRLIGMLKGAAKIIANAVQCLVETDNDLDHQAMILLRMSRLKLQFGFVRKHPEDLIVMTCEDAQTLLAPALEKCDLECPCITIDENGNQICNKAMVKACETRKALKRIGMRETGLSMDCPYQMMTGNEK